MSTIMVVDDDPDVLDTIVTVLSRSGHCVLRALGGRAALDILDGGKHPDLLLTDIIMPGLNGFSLARLAKSRRPTLKILFLSGYCDPKVDPDDDVARGGKLLAKPITPDALRREVGAALAS